MRIVKCLLALLAIGFATGSNLYSKNERKDIKVEFLGKNNSILKIKTDLRYLLVPVEEKEDDSNIGILRNGKLDRTIYVKLAKKHIDYYVPVDLSEYKNEDVVFNIITNDSSVNELKAMICWDSVKLDNSFDTANIEKFRPVYHHTPLYGWMNDPNGMFYKDGVWHLYYQYNPYGSKWQNMTWGHSTTKDFINWEHHNTVLHPDALGSIFSGNCVVDKQNTAGFGENSVIAIYTSAGINQMQSMASSTDNGHNFKVYPKNPILTLETEARDPSMFWNEDTKEWNMILAHALEHEMLIFSSKDLKTWELKSSFGKGMGSQDGVWECPNLVKLPVIGTKEEKWVLICNINPGGLFGGSATQYFVGNFDGKKFTVDNHSNKVPTKWMDYGKDHYATVLWHNAPQNRHVALGWMSNWQYADRVPTKQFRSANTLPRDVALFKGDDNEYYMSVSVSPEIKQLRDKIVTKDKSKNIGKKAKKYNLPKTNTGVCEINIDFDCVKAKSVELVLSNKKGDEVKMIFDPKNSTLSFDRTKSGITDFSKDFESVTVAPIRRNSTELSLQIFVDRSSIEIFDGKGNFSMTNIVFPNEPYSTLAISSDDSSAKLKSLEIYSIKK